VITDAWDSMASIDQRRSVSKENIHKIVFSLVAVLTDWLNPCSEVF